MPVERRRVTPDVATLTAVKASGRGTGGGGADGRMSGRVSGDGYEYEYVCREGRLVHFDFRTN